MAHVLIMPRQGNTVESCIICEWKVREGDNVLADTPVCSVETDKAAFEIPAGSEGTVLKILHSSGDDVPVLQPIMVIGKAGENWESSLTQAVLGAQPAAAAASAPAAAPVPAQAAAAQSAVVPAQAVSADIAAVSPRARNLAYSEAVDLSQLGPGSGPGGRIIEQDLLAYLEKRPPLTKAAKDELRQKISAGLQIHLTGEGTGLGGRVTAAEINQAAAAPMGGSAPILNAADEYTDTPIRGIRKIIADQMLKSHLAAASFTLNANAQAKMLLELRSQFKASPPETGMNRITINDLVLFAVSRTLPLYPYMNAHKNGESIRTWKNVHLGVAVSTNRGLMVPVIRNADRLSLAQISGRSRELAEACRNGSVNPDDLHGSTFTISNLGNTGIESFTPVINIPEAAILGVCSIMPKPAETAPGHYEIIPQMGLSLTIDHTVVDGAPAALFLQALCNTIRDIVIWLIK